MSCLSADSPAAHGSAYLLQRAQRLPVGAEQLVEERAARRVGERSEAHTNTVEGLFGNLKRGIAGKRPRGLEEVVAGLCERVRGHNHRRDGRAMFETLLLRAAA